jgi:hypothetical protein
MTKYSGASKNCKKWDGNAILIRQNTRLNYIFIGGNIINFKADSEITTFMSPVGNSGVPYTYAISKKCQIYLFLENIVIDVSKMDKSLLHKFIDGSDEPYTYYYILLQL